MSDGEERRWSPARDPYAIAVSQAWWAFQSVLLFAADARNASSPAQQIYARQIFGQLRALRRSAEMQAKELVRLGVSDVDRACLDRAIEEFDVAVPDARHARTSSSTLTSTHAARASSSERRFASLGSTCTRRRPCTGAAGMTPRQSRSLRGLL